jgi:hypothetical protein
MHFGAKKLPIPARTSGYCSSHFTNPLVCFINKGCFYVVIAFSIAEFGSGAIAVDAEWRKTGGQSRGLKRVVIFGLSRLVNVVLLYQIWLVTPTVRSAPSI